MTLIPLNQADEVLGASTNLGWQATCWNTTLDSQGFDDDSDNATIDDDRRDGWRMRASSSGQALRLQPPMEMEFGPFRLDSTNNSQLRVITDFFFSPSDAPYTNNVAVGMINRNAEDHIPPAGESMRGISLNTEQTVIAGRTENLSVDLGTRPVWMRIDDKLGVGTDPDYDHTTETTITVITENGRHEHNETRDYASYDYTAVMEHDGEEESLWMGAMRKAFLPHNL